MNVKKKLSGGKIAGNMLRLIRKKWFGGRCMYENDNGTQCSCTVNLELAHVIDTKLSRDKPNFRSSYERLKDTLDNPECLLLFCQTHHRLYDGRESETWQRGYDHD